MENVLTQEAAHIDGVGGAHAYLKGRRSAPRPTYASHWSRMWTRGRR